MNKPNQTGKQGARKTAMRAVVLFLLVLWPLSGVRAQYRPDRLGDGFECRVLTMPDDYDGPVVTTLVRRTASRPVQRALLYVHGFNDYFFQRELAEQFNDSLFNFYAVDLRKYGRSLQPHQYPFQVRDLSEYFADIDTALQIIRREGNREIVLMGHSTGGLITALYCQRHRDRLSVRGLILNSPFLDMNQSWLKENVLIPLVSLYGYFDPTTKIPQGVSTAYAESLLKTDHGEWEYDTNLKFRNSPPLTSGWIRAIHQGHEEAQNGLQIPCPVLVLFSDKSVPGDDWTPAHQRGDAVLDVQDIARYGKGLGPHVTEIEIRDGLHDLILSRKEVRERVYREIFAWMKARGLFRPERPAAYGRPPFR